MYVNNLHSYMNIYIEFNIQLLVKCTFCIGDIMCYNTVYSTCSYNNM